jgi:iron complex outermembrane receptor protein
MLNPYRGLAGLACAAAALLINATATNAQSVNYGQFEQLFGEPITTSATGKPQKVSEVPVDMEIITQDDIRRSGADNIPDVLQFVTGLDFRRSSFNDGEVAIRGYDQPWNPRLLVLVNDRPVYEDFYGDVVWAAFPVQLEEIRQIEVIKGPNSALFGFNAASGVINIVTYDPLQDNANAVTLRTGTQALKEVSGVATYHLGNNFGVRLSGGGMQANEFSADGLPPENARAGAVRPQDRMLNLDTRWQATPDILVSVEGNIGVMRRNFPADETPEDDSTTTVRARLTAKTDIGVVDVDGYWTTWKINYLGSQAQQAQNDVYDLRVSDLFKINPANTVRINAEFKNNSAQGEFLNGSTISYSVYSVGGMWDWRIEPDLTLSNAVRNDYLQLGIDGPVLPATGFTAADYNNATVDAVSFNSGLVYAISDIDVVRVTAARGFQLPSLDDLAQQIPLGGGLYDAGQPNLMPTSVLNFSLGFDHTFSEWGAVFRSAVFYQGNRNLFGYDVATVTLGPNTLFQSRNIGGSNELGFEIGLKSDRTETLRWRLSYQFATIHDHIDPDIAPGVYSAFQGSTPQSEVIGGLGYTFGPVELDTLARWQSSYIDYRLNGGVYGPVLVNNYLTMNARAGYHVLDELILAATAEQFNDASIFERASVAVDRRVILSATAQF